MKISHSITFISLAIMNIKCTGTYERTLVDFWYFCFVVLEWFGGLGDLLQVRLGRLQPHLTHASRLLQYRLPHGPYRPGNNNR